MKYNLIPIKNLLFHEEDIIFKQYKNYFLFEFWSYARFTFYSPLLISYINEAVMDYMNEI